MILISAGTLNLSLYSQKGIRRPHDELAYDLTLGTVNSTVVAMLGKEDDLFGKEKDWHHTLQTDFFSPAILKITKMQKWKE